MITHYDLFAGIGGFSLALDEVFDEPIRHIFCEWEDFPTQVLYKHWPQGEFYGDIKELIKCLESAQCANNPMCSHRLKKNENGGVVTVHPARPSTTKNGAKRTEKDTLKLEENGTKPADLKSSNTMAENVPVVESLSQLSLLSTTSKATAMQIENETALEAGISQQEKVIPTSSNSSATTATWQNHGLKSARIKENQNETEADIAELVEDTGRSSVQGKQPRRTDVGGTDFTIVTGGFPCQPFSAAGRRRGTSDDRYKWPEMFAVIRNIKPDWVIAENVRGLVTWNEGMVLETVCADLEALGYEVQPLIIPAVAVNAPHRRDRVWIIANNVRRESRPRDESESAKTQEFECSPNGTNATNPGRKRQAVSQEQTAGSEQHGGNAQDSISLRSRGWHDGPGQGRSQRLEPQIQDEGPSWSENWPEVATELCLVDDGLSSQLVRLPNGTQISYQKWRKESLKAGGNAIVPQVAIEIMKGIRYADQ